jgi:hypothetical protein
MDVPSSGRRTDLRFDRVAGARGAGSSTSAAGATGHVQAGEINGRIGRRVPRPAAWIRVPSDG